MARKGRRVVDTQKPTHHVLECHPWQHHSSLGQIRELSLEKLLGSEFHSIKKSETNVLPVGRPCISGAVYFSVNH